MIYTDVVLDSLDLCDQGDLRLDESSELLFRDESKLVDRIEVVLDDSDLRLNNSLLNDERRALLRSGLVLEPLLHRRDVPFLSRSCRTILVLATSRYEGSVILTSSNDRAEAHQGCE